MGIEDAVVLADELKNEGDINGALVRFMSRRYERAKTITECSIAMAAWEVNPQSGIDIQKIMANARSALAMPI